MSGNWNEYNLNPLTRIHWRASLVPAAAVIPAPIAYVKIAAVKKLVVGFLVWCAESARKGECLCVPAYFPNRSVFCPSLGWSIGLGIIYFEKIRVFKAGISL